MEYKYKRKTMAKHVEQLNHVKLFEEWKSGDPLPLSSLEWEFWTQSRWKVEAENLLKKGDSDSNFTEHCEKFNKKNIEVAAEENNCTVDDIKKHLRKYWDESRRGKYTDMHKDKTKFRNFRAKNMFGGASMNPFSEV